MKMRKGKGGRERDQLVLLIMLLFETRFMLSSPWRRQAGRQAGRQGMRSLDLTTTTARADEEADEGRRRTSVFS